MPQAKGSSQAPERMLTCWPCSAIQTRRTSKEALSRAAAGGISRSLAGGMGGSVVRNGNSLFVVFNHPAKIVGCGNAGHSGKRGRFSNDVLYTLKLLSVFVRSLCNDSFQLVVIDQHVYKLFAGEANQLVSCFFFVELRKVPVKIVAHL